MAQKVLHTDFSVIELARKHLHGFTWSWYIMPLSSLGLSLLFAALPYRFNGLTTIGIIVYLLGVVEFVVLSIIIFLRFISHTGAFIRSVSTDSEAFFLATFLLSIASMIAGAHQYGKPEEGSRLASTLRVMFWIYAVLAYLFGVYIYILTFERHHLLVPNMTPAWMLPMFPVILTGTIGSIVASSLESNHRFPILICSLGFQGLGTLTSLLITSIYLLRLFQCGLPEPNARPGLFLAVGPPSFTIVAIIKMAADIPIDYSYFPKHPGSEAVLQTMSLFVGIFFWIFAFWLFCLALCGTLMTVHKMTFHLNWYTFVFPNAGFTIATLSIANLLDCPALLWVATGAAILLTAVYILVVIFHVRAVYRGCCLI